MTTKLGNNDFLEKSRQYRKDLSNSTRLDSNNDDSVDKISEVTRTIFSGDNPPIVFKLNDNNSNSFTYSSDESGEEDEVGFGGNDYVFGRGFGRNGDVLSQAGVKEDPETVSRTFEERKPLTTESNPLSDGALDENDYIFGKNGVKEAPMTVNRSFLCEKATTGFTAKDFFQNRYVTYLTAKGIYKTFNALLVLLGGALGYLPAKEVTGDNLHKLILQNAFYLQCMRIQELYNNFAKKPTNASFEELRKLFELLHEGYAKKDHGPINELINKQIGGVNLAEALLQYTAESELKPNGQFTRDALQKFLLRQELIIQNKTWNGYGKPEDIQSVFYKTLSQILKEDPKNYKIANGFCRDFTSRSLDVYLEGYNDAFTNVLLTREIDPSITISAEKQQEAITLYQSYCEYEALQKSLPKQVQVAQENLETIQDDLDKLENTKGTYSIPASFKTHFGFKDETEELKEKHLKLSKKIHKKTTDFTTKYDKAIDEAILVKDLNEATENSKLQLLEIEKNRLETELKRKQGHYQLEIDTMQEIQKNRSLNSSRDYKRDYDDAQKRCNTEKAIVDDLTLQLSNQINKIKSTQRNLNNQINQQQQSIDDLKEEKKKFINQHTNGPNRELEAFDVLIFREKNVNPQKALTGLEVCEIMEKLEKDGVVLNDSMLPFKKVVEQIKQKRQESLSLATKITDIKWESEAMETTLRHCCEQLKEKFGYDIKSTTMNYPFFNEEEMLKAYQRHVAAMQKAIDTNMSSSEKEGVALLNKKVEILKMK